MLTNMNRLKDGQAVKKAAYGISRFFFFAAAFFAASFLLSVVPVSAQIPIKFNYQGNLRQAGFLVNGSRSMNFYIYDSSHALPTDYLWKTPSPVMVNISTGVFRVSLEPDITVWSHANLWLELEVEGNRMSPMEEITASPFSVNTAMLSGKRYTTTGSAPSNPIVGDLWMNGTAKQLKYWDGDIWTSGSGAGLPGIHAITHIGGASDPIISLGAHDVTGNVTLAPGASLVAGTGSAAVNVASNLSVTGTLNPYSSLAIGGAGYSVTVASTAYFNGYAVFQSTVQLADGNLQIGTTAPKGRVLKSQGNGFAYWGTENVVPFTGTPYRLQMADGLGNELVNSLFLQNPAETNITLISGSSLTVTGNFGAAGSGSFGGAVDVTGILNAKAGLIVTGSNATISKDLFVEGNSQLGDATNDLHSINRSNEAGVALSVDSPGGSGSYAAKFYSGGTLAAWIKKK